MVMTTTTTLVAKETTTTINNNRGRLLEIISLPFDSQKTWLSLIDINSWRNNIRVEEQNSFVLKWSFRLIVILCFVSIIYPFFSPYLLFYFISYCTLLLSQISFIHTLSFYLFVLKLFLK